MTRRLLAALCLLWGAAAFADNREQLQRWVVNLQTAPSFKVRLQAAILLGRSHDAHAVGPLIAALRDAHIAVRGAACLALANLGQPAGVEPLLGVAATDDDEYVRGEARKALRQFDHTAAWHGVLAAANTSDPELRREAILLLSSWDTDEARLRLVEALGDTVAIHQIAHDALFALGDDTRIALLRAGLDSQSLQVRLGSAALLEELGTAKAVALLMDAYDQEVESSELRRALRDHLRALHKLMPERKLLDDATNADDRFQRSRALKFLGVLGTAQAIDVLLAALNSPDVYLRGVAALSLAEAGDPRAIAPLAKLIEDQNNSRIVQIVRNSIQILQRKEAPMRN
jgi:HEAT repeat protein